jgi:hypothetical protein
MEETVFETPLPMLAAGEYVLGTNASARHRSHWTGLEVLALNDRCDHGPRTWKPPGLFRPALRTSAAARI